MPKNKAGNDPNRKTEKSGGASDPGGAPREVSSPENVFRLEAKQQGDGFDPFGNAWKTPPGTPASWFDKRGRILVFGADRAEPNAPLPAVERHHKTRPGPTSTRMELIRDHVQTNEKNILRSLKRSNSLSSRRRIALKIGTALRLHTAHDKPDQDVMRVLRELTKSKLISRQKAQTIERA
jgi:hypothetical protein